MKLPPLKRHRFLITAIILAVIVYAFTAYREGGLLPHAAFVAVVILVFGRDFVRDRRGS